MRRKVIPVLMPALAALYMLSSYAKTPKEQHTSYETVTPARVTVTAPKWARPSSPKVPPTYMKTNA